MFSKSLGEDIELRLLAEYHSEELFLLTIANREHLKRWLPWLDTIKTAEDTRKFIHLARENFARNGSFQAGIWWKGQLAGVIGLHLIDWLNRCSSVGYWLGENFEGNGIITRVCEHVLDYTFFELYLHRVEIRCATGNFRSQNIPARLGMTNEGVRREVEWLYDHFVDHIVYSSLAREWKLRRLVTEVSAK